MRLDLSRAGAIPARLSPSVWRLGSYHLAVYLVRGQGASALFEVGVSHTAELVLAQLSALGVPPGEIAWVVVSHAHGDHACGQERLVAALPNARLVMTVESARHLARPATLGEYLGEDAYTGAEVARREQGREWAGPLVSQLLPRQPQALEPGDELDVGGTRLVFMSQDGHVPGGLGAWLPGEGVLVSSDATGYVSLGRPGLPMSFVSHGGYMANLDRLAALGAEVLAPGHQDCFSGRAAAGYLDLLRGDMEAGHRAILAALDGGQSEDRVAGELFNRYYRDELGVFPAETIRECCDLLVRRSREHRETGDA